MALIHSNITQAIYYIKVATPVITPASGDLEYPVTCSITCSTAGATIRYTTDLSTPTDTHGTIYTGPFTLTESIVNVKAVAYKENLTNSDIANNDWFWVDEPSWAGTNPTYAPPGVPTQITIDDGVGPFTWITDGGGYFASSTTDSGTNYYYGAGGMACSYEHIYVTDYWGITVTGTMYGICGNDSESIGYTTLQMSVDEEQTLTVVADATTLSGCSGEYGWEISSGGGSLSTASGISTVYTAPSTNVNCNENPTIKLYACGREVDSIDIAVNGYELDPDDYVIQWKWEYCASLAPGESPYNNPYVCPATCRDPFGYPPDYNVTACYYCATTYYDCDGALVTENRDGYMTYSSEGTCTFTSPSAFCEDCANKKGTPNDLRTTAEKNGGCCPYQLM